MSARGSQDLPRRIADLDGQDAYAVLGIEPDADRETVVAAYRRQMAAAHPDLGGSAGRAQLVNCAYDVLTRHRDDYDELLGAHLRGGRAGVLFVEPDDEPLDDAEPRRGERRLSGRGSVLPALVAVALVVVGLFARREDPAPPTAEGWTASQVVDVSPTPPARTGAGGHRCELHQDGSLWCAGGNARGQVGNGTTREVADPVRVGTADHRWSAVAVGVSATCALAVDGAVWCWGDNSFGQLGDGTDSARALPVPVAPADRFLALDLDRHACAVRTDHTLWCWGTGRHGELGDGGSADRTTPVRLGSEATWAAVTVGSGWTCGVRQDGTRQCWGATAP